MCGRKALIGKRTWCGADMTEKFIDIVFDGPPGPNPGRFVEVENESGESICAGEWIDRGDGMWALRVVRGAGAADAQQAEKELSSIRRDVIVPLERERDALERELRELRASKSERHTTHEEIVEWCSEFCLANELASLIENRMAKAVRAFLAAMDVKVVPTDLEAEGAYFKRWENDLPPLDGAEWDRAAPGAKP
jgi:hypothetical protein